MSELGFTKSEMMIVAAPRETAGHHVCFVGVGLPHIAVHPATRTVAGLTPCAFAMVRHDQCVWPGGLSCKVASTIASTFSAGIDGLRPRPPATFPSLARPSPANRSRQARTVTADTPVCRAIAVFATPSAASSSTRACSTSRCGAVADLASMSRICRWLSARARAGAAWFMLNATT